MAKINSIKLFELLEDINIINKQAKDIDDIAIEIDKVTSNLNHWLKNLEAEKAIKKILWEGILKQYGTYGTKSGQVKSFKKKNKNKEIVEFDFNEQFSKGKLLSIDFGTSNIDRELSLTHTGIVLADYTGFVLVVPITSQSSLEFENLAPDIQKDIIPIYKMDYNQIENNSYILIHQMRVVSKNRITKKGIIGSLAGTEIMKVIEDKLIKIIAFDYYNSQQEKILSLEKEIENLKLQLT
ncbi:type II toxin-antitoxin system PemK/MazF family toxin [Bacillus sp. Bva_UNVM-123]|uniref:type II toxin-antitoxin system PemK/MazF family toxin n=1 Tax=Bacillus sp. Bva_UNVM-123 TaxID=2829798 RepID=UPI00391F7514